MKELLLSTIQNALKEDIGGGDYTSTACVKNTKNKKAQLITKEDCIISGVELAKIIFLEADNSLHIRILKKDGTKVKKNDVILEMSGSPLSILKTERLVLNYMQRMSGIATKTYELNEYIKHTKTKILDTRKTTPLNRLIEKWAVKIGGGINHRFGLYDLIMIKDNHIDFSGGIKNAIKNCCEYLAEKKLDLKIIIEARNLNEVDKIIECGGIKRILLDNFSIAETSKAVSVIKNKFEIESSGGITEKNIANYANCGVDYISVGCITHNVKSIDLSIIAINESN